MQFIIYSIYLGATRCKQVDAPALSPGDIAIACPDDASPNDPVWHEIAADHQTATGIVFDVRGGLDADDIARMQVPEKVSRRQALQALFSLRNITMQEIEAAIGTGMESPDRELALIEFREAQEFERARPLVVAMGPLLGLTPPDLDHLFVVADTL